jgi:hypothetical protein
VRSYCLAIRVDVDIAQDIKEFALGERINAFEIFEFNHVESGIVTECNHRFPDAFSTRFRTIRSRLSLFPLWKRNVSVR